MNCFKNVDAMTSRDFQLDTRAYVDMQGDYLKDRPVINFFRDTILLNKHLFKDKVVLNLACGVGILSLFAAKAGAKYVYAVDNSNVTDYAEKVVKDNKMESVIRIIRGCVEDVTLPVKKVDIILSDWIGYSILFQGRCDDVIYARDKWLRENGLIIPDLATLYLRGFEDEDIRKQRIEWWDVVYGFDMHAVKKSVLSEPLFRKVCHNNVLTNGCAIKTINLNKARNDDMICRSRFFVKVFKAGHLDGLFTSFIVRFSKSHIDIKLNTDHNSEMTRWVHTRFFFNTRIRSNKNDEFYGGIEMIPSPEGNLKKIDIRVEMFSGDQDTMNLEVDNNWIFKSHEYVENDRKNLQNAKKLDKTTKNILKENSVMEQYKKNPNLINKDTVNNKHITSPNRKIIIGTNEYTIKIDSRKKTHHNRKHN